MLTSIVEQISKEFINEAINSPILLEDMAAMEKYMAESYGGRIFIELLQNADDASSTKIKLCEYNGNLIFANNGRAFNEKDVITICRSGSSSKEKGIHIGYRGIGFKSTTFLTKEIIIYSSQTLFSFSKLICSTKLKKSLDKVPTVRIPFLINENEIDSNLWNYIINLSDEGFNTIFVFRNAKFDDFIEEITEINSGFFIFLRNVKQCEISVKGYNSNYLINRIENPDFNIIKFFGNNNDQWLIVGKGSTRIAFKLKDNELIPCNGDEAVFYCFLPTLDKVSFPIKINGNFSTDPSRKHLIIDQTTIESIQKIGDELYELILGVLNGEKEIIWANLLMILTQNSSFSKINTLLREEIRKKIIFSKQLRLNNGELSAISSYKVFPDWLEESEQVYIRGNSTYVKNLSINQSIYAQFPKVDEFVRQYSTVKFTATDFVEIMSEKDFVGKLNPLSKGKIIGNLIKTSRVQSITGDKFPVDKILLQHDDRFFAMSDLIAGNENQIDKQLKNSINQYVDKSDITWFCESNLIDKRILVNETHNLANGTDSPIMRSSVQSKPSVSRWRSAEQQCVELEKSFGFTPTDVSKQNLGYDIVSKIETGGMRYVEVKSLASQGGSISMTNNEYTAAHQYGDSYFLCLIIQTTDNLKATYIQNPLKNLQLEKRVKVWEWYCDNYRGDEITVEF